MINLINVELPVFRKTYIKRLALQKTVISFIEDRLLDPNLSVSMIVTSLCVPRSTLYRLFDNDGVDSYIRARRLSGAHADISFNVGNLTIGEIAKRWCFCDGSYLTRLFKKSYGITPKQFDRRNPMKGPRLVEAQNVSRRANFLVYTS